MFQKESNLIYDFFSSSFAHFSLLLPIKIDDYKWPISWDKCLPQKDVFTIVQNGHLIVFHFKVCRRFIKMLLKRPKNVSLFLAKFIEQRKCFALYCVVAAIEKGVEIMRDKFIYEYQETYQWQISLTIKYKCNYYVCSDHY